jgi:hypothetical protein
MKTNFVAVVALVVTGACSKASEMAPTAFRSSDSKAAEAPPPPPPAPEPMVAGAAAQNMAALDGLAMDKSEKKLALKDARVGTRGRGRADDAKAKNDEDGADQGGEAAPPAAPTRAWFPETFLFAPRVITNDDGTANVDVTVPDRLTTWRVLALAHSRKGAQAGALTTLQSQLPVSVDLVVPPFLVAGDRVALPVQVTNTTDKAIARTVALKVEGDGAMKSTTLNAHVDAEGTATDVAWLDAIEPGTIGVQADAGSDDSVRRTIAVKSGGRPRHAEHSGTLAQKRSFAVALDPGVLDHSAQATLQVFPGALAILKSEIASAPDRDTLDDDGYLLALAARAHDLSAKLGAPVDDKTIAHLQRIAAQRIARRAMTADPLQAAVIAPGALGFAPDGLIGRSGQHLAALIARSQRPDGTFGGGGGWPLSRVLVATAAGVRAVDAARATPTAADGSKDEVDEAARRANAVDLKAKGAFERFGGQIDDPYTAAVVVATGAVTGALADELRAKVITAIVDDGDGKKALLPAGLRGDGTVPTKIEATSWAILALQSASDAKQKYALPDLGATVLSAYRPGIGFGDGATNRVAFDAVTTLFADKLPAKVAITLSIDGNKVGGASLEGDALHDVAVMGATLAKAGDKLDVVVEADPPLPGLSYVLTVEYGVPWPKAPVDAGLSLDVAVKGGLQVGKAADLVLRATAPGGAALHVVQGLPAGVDAVKSSLDALVSSGSITKYDVTDGVVTMDAPARRQGELFNASFKIMPTLAGSLHSRVASVSIANAAATEVFFPPSTWTISR